MAGTHHNDDRDRVLAATDLLSIVGEVVRLVPKGREHAGICPFHDDKSPSMSVVTHKSGYGADSFFKCFACGAGGNAIDFVMRFHKFEFPEALAYLASRAGIELTPWNPSRSGGGLAAGQDGKPTRDEVVRANAIAQGFFRETYADARRGARAQAEVARRGFETDVVKTFGIGAAPSSSDALLTFVRHKLTARDNNYPPFDAFVEAGVIRPGRSGHIDLLRDRLVFPIRDEMGRPIAFGGRKLDPEQEPKYLNSPESPVFHKGKALYGIDLAKRSIMDKKTAIITEGYTDVIACHRAGFTNSVATLGTALTREHARVLRRLCENVVLLFDADEAGLKAADRALEVFFSESIDIRICVLPGQLDPDDLLRQEDGAAQFRTALDASSDLLTYMSSRIRQRIAGHGLSAKQQAIETTLAKFVDLGINTMNGLRRHLVLQSLSELFDVSVRDLDRLCMALRPRGAVATDPTPASAAASRSTLIEPAGLSRNRARNAAERRLLAFLCLEPGLASHPVLVEGGCMLPLCEVLAPNEFADADHAAIFAPIRSASENARPLPFASLLGDLGDERLKCLASNLYAFGEELLQSASSLGSSLGQARTASEELVASWRDLEALERRDRLKSREAESLRRPTVHGDPVDGTPRSAEVVSSSVSPSVSKALDPEQAMNRLARRRERGHDPTTSGTYFGSQQSQQPKSDGAEP